MDIGDEGSPWGDEPSTSKPKQDLNASVTSNRSEGQSSSVLHQSSNPTEIKSTGGRGSKTIKRYGTQKPQTESIDDPLGPLGPLGDASLPASQTERPPIPPQKEQQQRQLQQQQQLQQNQPQSSQATQAARNAAAPMTGSQSSSLRGMMESVNLFDDDDERETRISGARTPPPVQFPNRDVSRSKQPSVSVEQAAKPSFHITVGDPHKVGDLTSSHTVYQVRTKTTSKAYRNPEFEVSRRYKDFLWVYNQLHSNNPGVVVPPPPDKQAVGRFESDFVESRRAALERMLNKVTSHHILQHDADLKIFLESEAFNMDVRNKERKDPGFGESKGVLGSIGWGSSNTSKFVEYDDWFHDRRVYLDALENQLKALQKATDTVISQRKYLAEACGDFSISLQNLAAVELSPSLSGPLDGLAELQMRVRELYERQAQQDVLTIGIVIDEYIRLVGSVKMAFQQRQKAYHSWHTTEAELQKRKATQDKLLRQGRSQQDRLNAVNAEVADAERKAHQARLLFEDLGRLMRAELDRFEREKVEDFKSGVETYLESAVEAQKELIELWETYLMRLDADDEDDAFGNGKIPVGVVATPADGEDAGNAAAAAPATQVSDSFADMSQSQITDLTDSMNAFRAADGGGGRDEDRDE